MWLLAAAAAEVVVLDIAAAAEMVALDVAAAAAAVGSNHLQAVALVRVGRLHAVEVQCPLMLSVFHHGTATHHNMSQQLDHLA